MKIIYLLLSILFIPISIYSQTKSTPVISFNADMTAQFTLDNATSKVTLVLTGSANKWASVGIGTSTSTTSGDVYVFTSAVTNNTANTTNTNEEWNTISNTVTADRRTVVLERTLTNSDLNDMQMAFDSTKSLDVVWSRSGSAIAAAPAPNRGSTTAVFTTNLGLDTLVSNDEIVIYPNPTSGELNIKTNTNLSKVTIYSQTGALIKTIDFTDDANEKKINVNDLSKDLYILELQNDSKKTFRKVLLN